MASSIVSGAPKIKNAARNFPARVDQGAISKMTIVCKTSVTLSSLHFVKIAPNWQRFLHRAAAVAFL
jgi:hypothetical protein